jgi:hypothetical protein
MTSNTANRNVFTAVTLILMFLLADVFVPSAFPAPELLEEEPSVQQRYFNRKSIVGHLHRFRLSKAMTMLVKIRVCLVNLGPVMLVCCSLSL